ncbi:hypothetical protein GH733_000803 [Mirounga leonina]|nr:hypothetical protein GH733_000803 [Mirounga leonina]
MRKFNIRKVLDGLTAGSSSASQQQQQQQHPAGNREPEIQETLQSEHFQLCKLLIGFESGTVVLWDLKSKKADYRYTYDEDNEGSWFRSLFVHKVDPRKDAHSTLLSKKETSNLYKIQFHNVKPECLDAYNSLTEAVLPKLHLDEDYPCSLVGNWNTWYGEQDQAYRQENQEAVGGFFSQIGELYIVHHLWAYKDLQSREETRNAAWRKRGWDENVYYTVPLVRHMESRIMIPLKISPLQVVFGNCNGIAMVDYLQKAVLLNLGTIELYGSNDPYRREPRSPRKSRQPSGGLCDISEGTVVPEDRCKSPTSEIQRLTYSQETCENLQL